MRIRVETNMENSCEENRDWKPLTRSIDIESHKRTVQISGEATKIAVNGEERRVFTCS